MSAATQLATLAAVNKVGLPPCYLTDFEHSPGRDFLQDWAMTGFCWVAEKVPGQVREMVEMPEFPGIRATFIEKFGADPLEILPSFDPA